MNTEMLYRMCRKALWGIALLLTAVVCALNILYRSDVASTGYEYVTVSSHFSRSIPMLVLMGSVIVIASVFRKTVEKTDERKLFRYLAAVYTILAVYLIVNVDNVIRADAKEVFSAALDVKNGIYSAFQPGQYMYRYPHQIGLMLYDKALSAFSENPKILFIVNFLLVLGINHLSWKIGDEVFHDKLTNVLTIVFSFLFLPQLFFILFAYGLIPGFFFLMLGFYQTLCYVRTNNVWNLAIMVFAVGIAAILKQNFLIGGIAIIIYLFLHFLQNRNLRHFAAILLLVLSMIFPAEGLKLWYGNAAGVELNNSNPSILWVVMGTNIDNEMRGPGWYDNSSWNLYNESGFAANVASELGKQKLVENWNKIKTEPYRAGKFFLKKTVSQWCDPMYQSAWSGPLEDCGQYTHTEILQSLYTGGTWAAVIAGLMKLLCVMLWIFATVFLVLHGSRNAGWELMYLYFIGGLLFHMFWEGKSQYTYPYLFVLIPFAACSVRNIITRNK